MAAGRLRGGIAYDFVKPIAGFYTWREQLQAMPFNSSTPILFFNKSLFARAGLEKPATTRQRREEQFRRMQAAGVPAGMVLAGDYLIVVRELQCHQ